MPYASESREMEVTLLLPVAYSGRSVISHIHRIDSPPLDDLFDQIRPVAIPKLTVIGHGEN